MVAQHVHSLLGYWYFKLPSTATEFVSVSNVEINMQFRGVDSFARPVGTVLMFHIYRADLPKIGTDKNSSQEDVMMSTYPAANDTGLAEMCDDDFIPSLTLISSVRAEAYRNTLWSVGSDLRGNVEKGHLLYALRIEPKVVIEQEQTQDIIISVQTTGEILIPTDTGMRLLSFHFVLFSTLVSLFIQ
eukprot:Blabericola_migrator_1__12077@NODE_743_length_6671_cov_113_057692_g533_i0_p5_GENE_NODE_743_length_6671_cov_113_057692_g533_i0NODE_743_length_6671_cov_113_057692_g533_i0_p5_ORF_typecomplete_len187_score11_95_NODE_743_length_6671_cov_113_057692_g533_i059736533